MALTLASQICVLFLMGAGGFILAKTGLVQPSGSATISRLIIYLISPCVVINSFQIDLSPERSSGFLLSVIAAFIIQGVLFLVVFLLNKVVPMSPVEKCSVIYPNCAYLVIPLVTSILGSDWVIYCSGYMCVQGIFVWSHCQSTIAGMVKISPKKIFGNINNIAVVIGIVLFFTGIRLPSIVTSALSSMAATIGPLSMIMIGMILSRVNWKECFTNVRMYISAAFRLLLCPAILMLIFKFSPLKDMNVNGETILFISLLGVSAPSAMVVTQLAQLYNREEKYASSINVLTTVFCIATMPLMVMLYYL